MKDERIENIIHGNADSLSELIAEMIVEDALNQPGVREEIEAEHRALLYGDGRTPDSALVID